MQLIKYPSKQPIQSKAVIFLSTHQQEILEIFQPYDIAVLWNDQGANDLFQIQWESLALSIADLIIIYDDVLSEPQKYFIEANKNKKPILVYSQLIDQVFSGTLVISNSKTVFKNSLKRTLEHAGLS